jgi:hypothetical protein
MTFEQRVALMKPLPATEIEGMQHLGRWTWNLRNRSQPQNDGTGDQKSTLEHSRLHFENVVTSAASCDALFHVKKDDKGHYLLLGKPVFISSSLADIQASV